MTTARRSTELPDIARLQVRGALASALAVVVALGAAGLTATANTTLAEAAAAVAGVAAVLGAVLTWMASRRLRVSVLEPVDALQRALYRTVMGDPFSATLPAASVRELRELSVGMGELVDLVRLERSHKEALTDAAQSRSTTALEAALQTQLERERSEYDALTGLLNRRKLDADLDVACSVATRTGSSLAFCMVDVDHFKQFNDTHGHSKGDEVLRTLAQTLLNALRRSDTAYRYGGEEFSIILRECPPQEAAAAINRVRLQVVERFREVGMPMTASFGIAFLPHHGNAPKELIEAADGALYRAKENGRDQVVVAS